MSELKREQLLIAIISGNGPPYLRGVDLSSLDLSHAGWLVEADLRLANLSQINLRGANLQGARLRRANLDGANLVGTNFEGADLWQAKLTAANLRMANLRGANLRRARLVGANLAKANLELADLVSADLEGANLEGANLKGAKLDSANLSLAILEGADMEGTSLVDAVFGRVAEPVAEQGPPGFSGRIESIELTDLIQLVCLSKHDVLLRVKSPQGEGVIHIRSGRVCHARYDAVAGERAFFDLLQWDNGRFEVLPLSDEEITSIHKPVEHLIIESMRQRDERESLRNREMALRTHVIQEIRKHLPVPARASEEFFNVLGDEGRKIDPDQSLQITDVFDSGDKGGILCSIISGDDVFIAPLKGMALEEDHPLYGEILTYLKGEDDILE